MLDIDRPVPAVVGSQFGAVHGRRRLPALTCPTLPSWRRDLPTNRRDTVNEMDPARRSTADRRCGLVAGGRAARTTRRGGWSTHGGVPRPGSPRGAAG